jgi:hypothetical protein
MTEPAPEAPVDTAPADGASDDGGTPDVPGIPFELLLIVEGVETDDDRFIEVGALTWREPPLPLMSQLKSEHGGFADTAAEIGGRIDTITREPLGTWDGSPDPSAVSKEIIARGILDVAGEIGLETARFIAGGFLRGVSADMAVSAAEVEITAVDDDGFPIGERLIVTEAVIGMATVTPFAAFAECQIRLLEDVEPAMDPAAMPEMPQVGDRIPILADGRPARQSFTYTMVEGCLPCQERGTIVAAGGPLAPPAAWFDAPQWEDGDLIPQKNGETLAPLRVTREGRVFGHIAGWKTCHTGYERYCQRAPHSAADYAHFRTGVVRTAEGGEVTVGTLTLLGGHPDHSVSARGAVAHYDDTRSAFADVACGEDEHGIWVSGAVRPGVTDEQLRAFMGAKPSGDWRPLGSGLELVAVCMVNNPGFPVLRELVASGKTVGLTLGTGIAARVDKYQDIAALAASVETAGRSIASVLAPDVIAELTAFARERKADKALALIDAEFASIDRRA